MAGGPGAAGAPASSERPPPAPARSPGSGSVAERGRREEAAEAAAAAQGRPRPPAPAQPLRTKAAPPPGPGGGGSASPPGTGGSAPPASVRAKKGPGGDSSPLGSSRAVGREGIPAPQQAASSHAWLLTSARRTPAARLRLSRRETSLPSFLRTDETVRLLAERIKAEERIYVFQRLKDRVLKWPGKCSALTAASQMFTWGATGKKQKKNRRAVKEPLHFSRK
nr:collagen alpha-1(I) chain-like [Globicephala melas]